MFKVVLVDRDYGSVITKSGRLKKRICKNGIKLSLNHFTNEELIENCKDAEVLLCTGNQS